MEKMSKDQSAPRVAEVRYRITRAMSYVISNLKTIEVSDVNTLPVLSRKVRKRHGPCDS